MSKIGRKPIDIEQVKVEINGQDINYKGNKGSGTYTIPALLQATVVDNTLNLVVNKENKSRQGVRSINRVWGLHRALLANTLKGASQDFEKKLEINGLGFKAILTGSKVVFSLGFSHKIDFELPKEVTFEVDKTGQKLTLKSPNKELLGLVGSQMRALRPPEPYKGTGIKYLNEQIVRKAGKTKAAA